MSRLTIKRVGVGIANLSRGSGSEAAVTAVKRAVLGVKSAGIERCRDLVGDLHVDGRASGVGALSQILGDSGLAGPAVIAEHSEIARHVLVDIDDIIVVEHTCRSGSLLGHSVVDECGLVELGLARAFALCLAGGCRSLRIDIQILPFGLGSQFKGTGKFTARRATESVAGQRRVLHDERLRAEVDTATDARVLGHALAPYERLLKVRTCFCCHISEF